MPNVGAELEAAVVAEVPNVGKAEAAVFVAGVVVGAEPNNDDVASKTANIPN